MLIEGVERGRGEVRGVNDGSSVTLEVPGSSYSSVWCRMEE
jgi:hypothetical protein